MIRILHLLDRDAGFQAERSAFHLTRDLGTGFLAETRTIGRGGDYASVVAALTRLRRSESFDIIHAWGSTSLTAAAMTHRGRIVHGPADSPSAKSLRWLRAMMNYREVEVVCPTTTLRRACVERGVPLARCHLIRPGVEFSRIRRRRDPALRAALGFEDNDRVLLLAGESTRASGHRAGVWAGAILHRLDARYRMLAWGRGAQMPAVAKFAASQKSSLLSIAEQRLGRRVEFEALLPAADVVIVTADKPAATLPISICMAAALPIVATVAHTTSELLEDRHTALLAQPRSPRALARRILDIGQDTGLQWSISDMARTEAYEYFTLTRFLNQHRQMYRQIVAGEKVEVPVEAPGAGLRFHGRGG